MQYLAPRFSRKGAKPRSPDECYDAATFGRNKFRPIIDPLSFDADLSYFSQRCKEQHEEDPSQQPENHDHVSRSAQRAELLGHGGDDAAGAGGEVGGAEQEGLPEGYLVYLRRAINKQTYEYVV